MWSPTRPLLYLCAVINGPAVAINLRQAVVKPPGLALIQLQGHFEVGKVNGSAVHAAANVTAPASLKAHEKQSLVVVADATKPAAVQANLTENNVLSFKLGKNQMAVATMAVTVVVAALAMILVFVAAGLLVCAVYDLTANLIHRARFRSCTQKIQRAHAAFHSKTGDLPLCPYCCESFSTLRGPSKVTFLCGHRLHVECSNKWFNENPGCSTQCPICQDLPGATHDKCNPCCGKAEQPAATMNKSEGNNVVDGAFAFILGSLHRMYPEIVTKACVDRWLHCNTEIWLSELSCPRYNPVLSSTVNVMLGKTKA